ncbi:MAG: ATP-binding protein [Ilumatobacter sp.]|nr:MAG: ATP-binding protein [Ilumatobacter sp.]
MNADPESSPNLDARQQLYRQFGPAQVAVSTDGRDVHVTAPIEAGLTIGAFAIVETLDDDLDLVVQMRSAQLVEWPGPELQLATDVEPLGVGAVSAVVRPVLRAVTGSAAVLGTLGPDGFRRLAQVEPFGERLVRPARRDEIDTIVDRLSDATAIPIGVQFGAPDVPASMVAKGFARHTFLCGQSGSGKTYTTGVIFERLLAETSLPLVVLDPNSDHIHLGSLLADADPSPVASRFATVAPSVRVARARGHDADHVLCADFSDLSLEWQALLLRLDAIRDADEFAVLRRTTADLPRPFSVDDVVAAAEWDAPGEPLATRLVTRIRNLGIADWDVWRRQGETSMATANLRSERCVVFDLGSLPRPDERTAVALAVLGTRWKERHGRQPVLIAIDEAHNVLPATTDDPLLEATSELGVLIAGEGRKFGLHLFIATQRPAKVHPNVVTQCDNLVLMRMNGARDVDDLVEAFSHVPEAMVRSALGFGLGQALLAGPISPVPTCAQIGRRFSPEGGGDVPTTWATVTPPKDR